MAKHNFYSGKGVKTKSGVYPKLAVGSDGKDMIAAGPGRHDRRRAWAMAGVMDVRGRFFGGVVSHKFAGTYLMARYLSGRPMNQFPAWNGWKNGEPGSDTYRQAMKELRARTWKYDVRNKRKAA